MNKRNTIIVVFRVVAIFILFLFLTALTLAFSEWTRPVFGSSSIMSKLILSIVSIGIPLGIAYLLWKRSGWIADKILAPFGMDELWDDEIEIPDEELPETENLPNADLVPTSQSTITHLNREEIESIPFSVIAVWILTSSLPKLVRYLFGLLYSSGNDIYFYIGYLIVPLGKAIIAGWLLFRANQLTAWLKHWRENRTQD